MKATTASTPPAPTHIITGPSRRFWLAQDTDDLTGQAVSVRRQFSSHETAHITCRLTDGGWCHVPARHLHPIANPQP